MATVTLTVLVGLCSLPAKFCFGRCSARRGDENCKELIALLILTQFTVLGWLIVASGVILRFNVNGEMRQALPLYRMANYNMGSYRLVDSLGVRFAMVG